MKIFSASGFFFVLGIAGFACFSSCSDPQKEARNDLESRGYQVSPRDLFLAASSGDLEAIDLFAETGMDIDTVDKAGNTALIRAASSGQILAVERILGLGADPRHVNQVKRDALLSASAKGFDDVARMLISRGADPNLRDVEGWSALSIASFNGHSDMVSLLAGQVSSEALDDALLVASFNGDADVIASLLAQGADINVRSPEGKTPLMIAANGGKLPAVRVLLQNRANPYAEDHQGRTAANLADSGGFEQVKLLIISPDAWGTSPESSERLQEMADAKEALISEQGVDETLASGGDPELRQYSANEEAFAEQDLVLKQKEVSAQQAGSDESINPEVVAVAPKYDRVQLRKEAKAKPMVALNGSTIRSRSPEKAPVETMVLAAFHEEPIPIEVADVDGNRASIRRLDQQGGEPIEVVPGNMIPGTFFEVQDVTRKFVSSKENQGRMVDVSRVRVEDKSTGQTHLLVRDGEGQSSDTYAILTAPGSQYRYAVKAGDIFRTSHPGSGNREYQVLDIRASGVVIKDMESEEVVTVARDGIIPMP
ncbi:MAG: ankyrin repeat domain-containing protein [Verrucomicrobiota bacterium]